MFLAALVFIVLRVRSCSTSSESRARPRRAVFGKVAVISGKTKGSGSLGSDVAASVLRLDS